MCYGTGSMERFMRDGRAMRRRLWALLAITILGMSSVPACAAVSKVPELFVTSDRCLACHNDLITPSGQNVSIGANWQSSMMAHAARDPYWQAAVRRETLDHPESSEAIQNECSACHMPMARYQANAEGRQGQIFTHLPPLPVRTRAGELAADGVSCTLCHQIQPDKLDTEESFTAGFVIDQDRPVGQREIYGPYEIDAGRTRVMQSSAQVTPKKGLHIQDSALCGSCHTLFTHTLAPGGEVIGELPEQVPYLEWQHSVYVNTRSCQSCHMPELPEPMHITSVLGRDRQPFSRHVFRGGNFLMPKIFNRHRIELGVTAMVQDLEQTSEQSRDHLAQNTARLAIERADLTDGRLSVDVKITQLAGHKLPTAYPSRRVWLHMAVTDRNDRTVFESGKLQPDGAIAGNDNDADAARFEPHHEQIETHDQVQIYEAIMADADGNVTTGLLKAIRYVKDNRIPPSGFDKTTAGEHIAVHGRAMDDADFTAGTDTVRYAIALDSTEGPLTVKAELWYQPIGHRWARNLQTQQAEEIERFVKYYEEIAPVSGTILAETSRIIPSR